MQTSCFFWQASHRGWKYIYLIMLLCVHFILKGCGLPQLPFPACSCLRNSRRRARVCVWVRARARLSPVRSQNAMEPREWAVLTPVIWVSNTADQWVRGDSSPKKVQLVAEHGASGSHAGSRGSDPASRLHPPICKESLPEKPTEQPLTTRTAAGSSSSALRWDISPTEALQPGEEVEEVVFISFASAPPPLPACWWQQQPIGKARKPEL